MLLSLWIYPHKTIQNNKVKYLHIKINRAIQEEKLNVEPTGVNKREILQNAVGAYLGSGYRVISQTSDTAQLLKPKEFSCLFAILFNLFYVFYYLSKKDKTVYIQVDNFGQVISTGEDGKISDLGQTAPSKIPIKLILAIVGIVILLCLIVQFFTTGITIPGTGGSNPDSPEFAKFTQDAATVQAVMTERSVTQTPYVSKGTQVPSSGSSTLAQVRSDVSSALGDGNRGIPHLTDLQFDSTALGFTITIAGNDNTSSGSRLLGMKKDILTSLKVIYLSSSFSYDQITVIVTFPLVDASGKKSESKVISATYTRATVGKIDFDTFQAQNIFSVADPNVFIQPSMLK